MKIQTEKWNNSICLNLTNRCDTYCRYCFQESNVNYKDRVRLKDIERVLRFFSQKTPKTDYKFFQITGGEVTLHPEVFDIVKLAISYGYYVRMQSNGINMGNMNDKQLEILSSPYIIIKIRILSISQSVH